MDLPFAKHPPPWSLREGWCDCAEEGRRDAILDSNLCIVMQGDVGSPAFSALWQFYEALTVNQMYDLGYDLEGE